MLAAIGQPSRSCSGSGRRRPSSKQAYERALAAGALKRGDPTVMGVMREPADLPEARWSDVPGLSDTELAAFMRTTGDLVDQTPSGRVRLMSDAELNAVIMASAARPAP